MKQYESKIKDLAKLPNYLSWNGEKEKGLKILKGNLYKGSKYEKTSSYRPD